MRTAECLRIIAKRPSRAGRRVQCALPWRGFTGQTAAWPATTCGSTRWPAPPARPCTSTARRSSPSAIRRSIARSPAYPHRLHYAIKANATLAIVRHLRELGARADANSGGEIEVALRAGFSPRDIVFTGVGKTRRRAGARGDARPRGHQRRVARRGRSHRGRRARARPAGARRHAHQPGRGRRQPSAHLDRDARDQVRHVDRRGARDGARHGAPARICTSSVCTSTSDRRSRGPSRSSGAALAASRILPASCSRRASRSSTSIWAAASGSPTSRARPF